MFSRQSQYLEDFFFTLIWLLFFSFPLQRIPLTHMSRNNINNLLAELGFYKKAQAEDEVPEEFRFSPAKDSPFKEHHSKQASSDQSQEPQPEKESPHGDL